MRNFKEFQFATIVFAIGVPTQILLAFLFAYHIGNHPMTLASFMFANAVFALVYLLFYGMKTTVDQNIIRITYGIGLIRKTIKLSEVKSVHVVTSPWIYGWGIRVIPNGMLYNINGTAGVELTFKERPRVIRIGSGNAAALQNQIAASITSTF